MALLVLPEHRIKSADSMPFLDLHGFRLNSIDELCRIADGSGKSLHRLVCTCQCLVMHTSGALQAVHS